jgi:hypothetical protein
MGRFVAGGMGRNLATTTGLFIKKRAEMAARTAVAVLAATYI